MNKTSCKLIRPEYLANPVSVIGRPVSPSLSRLLVQVATCDYKNPLLQKLDGFVAERTEQLGDCNFLDGLVCLYVWLVIL